MEAGQRTEWLAIARLMRPQGRRGELLAEPLSDLPEIFGAGRTVTLAPEGAVEPASAAGIVRIEEHWFPTGRNSGRVVLKLSGCDTINQAETLAGQQLMIHAEEIPELDADTYLVGDLVGCAFYDAGQHMGSIVDVEFATAPDGRTRLEEAAPLLSIALTDGIGDPVLVPFVRAWLVEVDVPGKRVRMQLPAGLLDNSQEPVGEDEPVLQEPVF